MRLLAVRTGELLVVAAVLALVVGQLFGQPVLLSYVTSDSMEPTLEPGDGFVAVPAALAGPVEEGDVVVFRAEEVGGGGLTTHRVVAETERGFVTRGDGNPFTDQESGEPHVRRERVVSVALQVNGVVVTVPGVGAVVSTTQSGFEWIRTQAVALVGGVPFGMRGLSSGLFVTLIVLYVVEGWRADGGGRRTDGRSRRSGYDPRLITAVLVGTVVVSATAAMAVPAETNEFRIGSAEFESEQPGVIRSGTSESFAYRVDNAGLVPVVVVLEPGDEHVAVDSSTLRVGPRSTEEVRLTLTAPPEPGLYRGYLSEHRYLAVLPTAWILSLHAVHPWLPVLAVDAFLAALGALVGRALLGTGRLRFDRGRTRPTGCWLRRALRELYR